MNNLVISNLGDVRFATAGQFVARNHPLHPRRCLDSHVLLIGCTGTYPITQGSRNYTLGEGDFMLLVAGEEHYGIAPASAGQSHLWCHFHTVESTSITADTTGCEAKLVLPEFGKIMHMEKFRILFRQLIDAEYRDYADPRSRQSICDAYIRILLAELYDDCCAAQTDDHAGRGDVLAAQVTEWIRLHAKDGIQPHDVAAHFQYSNDYLTKILRQATGMTISTCINRHRLETAKKHLINTDLRINEIAERSGFSDEKYFMKVFRQYEHVTPTEYRKTYYRVHINSD